MWTTLVVTIFGFLFILIAKIPFPPKASGLVSAFDGGSHLKDIIMIIVGKVKLLFLRRWIIVKWCNQGINGWAKRASLHFSKRYEFILWKMSILVVVAQKHWAGISPLQHTWFHSWWAYEINHVCQSRQKHFLQPSGLIDWRLLSFVPLLKHGILLVADY